VNPGGVHIGFIEEILIEGGEIFAESFEDLADPYDPGGLPRILKEKGGEDQRFYGGDRGEGLNPPQVALRVFFSWLP
jgi:hypothetical protein